MAPKSDDEVLTGNRLREAVVGVTIRGASYPDTRDVIAIALPVRTSFQTNPAKQKVLAESYGIRERRGEVGGGPLKRGGDPIVCSWLICARNSG